MEVFYTKQDMAIVRNQVTFNLGILALWCIGICVCIVGAFSFLSSEFSGTWLQVVSDWLLGAGVFISIALYALVVTVVFHSYKRLGYHLDNGHMRELLADLSMCRHVPELVYRAIDHHLKDNPNEQYIAYMRYLDKLKHVRAFPTVELIQRTRTKITEIHARRTAYA